MFMRFRVSRAINEIESIVIRQTIVSDSENFGLDDLLFFYIVHTLFILAFLNFLYRHPQSS